MPDLTAKGELLLHLLRAYSPLALAFSGGLDSRFLAFAAKRLRHEDVQARLYFFQGPHMQSSEIRDSVAWAQRHDFALQLLTLDPLRIAGVRANERDRCYHCKLGLFTALYRHVAENPPFPGGMVTICDGSNSTDSLAYRPGMRALQELSVHSPLTEAGLGKEDIRKLAAAWGMDRPDQQSRPCLITRYEYGLAPDSRSLSALDNAEEAVRALLKKALGKGEIPPPLPDFRLRLVDRREASEDSPASGGPAGISEAAPAGAQFRPELHISADNLPEALQNALLAAVREQGFAVRRIVSARAVSGFYDRQYGIGGE